jgi:hypothetical protein
MDLQVQTQIGIQQALQHSNVRNDGQHSVVLEHLQKIHDDIMKAVQNVSPKLVCHYHDCCYNILLILPVEH